MLEIRLAQKKDAAALLAIYTPYVEKTAITFEISLPTIEEFAERIEKTLTKYPYLVVEENGHILGYAYASSYYGREAYDQAAELSIYLKENVKAKGIGTLLYDELEKCLEKQGIIHFLACISVPNEASLCVHSKRGYQKVGHFLGIGYKFGKWHDTIWFQKTIRNLQQTIGENDEEKNITI